jgi:hypothetical protein
MTHMPFFFLFFFFRGGGGGGGGGVVEWRSKYAYLSASTGGSPDLEFSAQYKANIINLKNNQQGENKFQLHIFTCAS